MKLNSKLEGNVLKAGLPWCNGCMFICTDCVASCTGCDGCKGKCTGCGTNCFGANFSNSGRED